MSNRFYASKAWLDCRGDVLIRDRYQCVECRNKGKITLATDVDHILPREQRPDLELDRDNCQSLCKPHHSKKTRRENR